MSKQIRIQVPKQRRPVEETEPVEPHQYDERELADSTAAELAEIDEVLAESMECMGAVAVYLAQEQSWRAAYLGKAGLAA